MATLEYSSPLPSVKEFIQQLREVEERYDPVEKLLELARELALFEQKYEISSAEFFQRFEAGEMGDLLDYFRWAGCYQSYLRLKEMISASLEIVVSASQPIFA